MRSEKSAGQSSFYWHCAASKRLAFACRVQVQLSATFSRQFQFELRVGCFRPRGWVGYSCHISHAWGRPTAFSSVVFVRLFGRCGLKQGGHLTSHLSGPRDVPKSLAFAALILCQTFRAITRPLNSSVMCWKFTNNMKYIVFTVLIFFLEILGCASETTIPITSELNEKCHDVGGCINSIVRSIARNWHRPENTKNGMVVLLEVTLDSDFKVVSVGVIEGSGNEQFDLSAVNAVTNANQFVELGGLPTESFQKNFKKFKLQFKPADLVR